MLFLIIYILAYDSTNIFVTILSENPTIILVLPNIFIFTTIEKQPVSEHMKGLKLNLMLKLKNPAAYSYKKHDNLRYKHCKTYRLCINIDRSRIDY